MGAEECLIYIGFTNRSTRTTMLQLWLYHHRCFVPCNDRT